MRLQYPSNIRVVRVLSTGKVDVLYILHSLEKGADGVYLVGCLEGGCHYNNGNLKARRRVEQAQSILETIGIEGERVQMYNLSSSDGPLFAKYAQEMDERIRKLGPNPIKQHKKEKAA